MNERIKQITGQVLDEIVPDTWTKLGYDKIKEIQYRTAELIVRECIGVVEGGRFLHEQAPTAVLARECSTAIKRHFGLNNDIG
jgi:hypothetical protein